MSCECKNGQENVIYQNNKPKIIIFLRNLWENIIYYEYWDTVLFGVLGLILVISVYLGQYLKIEETTGKDKVLNQKIEEIQITVQQLKKCREDSTQTVP
jgi:hypothetical protein